MNWDQIGAVAGIIGAVVGVGAFLFGFFIEWPKFIERVNSIPKPYLIYIGIVFCGGVAALFLLERYNYYFTTSSGLNKDFSFIVVLVTNILMFIIAAEAIDNQQIGANNIVITFLTFIILIFQVVLYAFLAYRPFGL